MCLSNSVSAWALHNSFRWLVIFTLHILAFFEPPSSLTWTSDMRYRGDRVQSPCWVMEMIEVICLLLLLADNTIRVSVLWFLSVCGDSSGYCLMW